ncbi:MAG: hypothetical protein IT561_09110 [Alphaproteobacteria bacterium]|nr:hypothetical protein [Alphaproteobacteria bacterium]
MVQMIENWSDVTATVVDAAASSGHATLSLRVEKADDVPPFANLMGDFVGRTVAVRVPSDLMAAVTPRPGDRVRLRVRRGGPAGFFAHPTEMRRA